MPLSFRLSRGVFWACLLYCFSAILVAQSERGTITGTVHDTTGAVIPGAKVTVTSTATNVVVTLTTNSVGEYTAISLPAGTYNIRVDQAGFRPAETLNVTVDAANTTRADLTM